MADKQGTNNTIQAAWVAVGSLFSMGFGIISAMILSRYFSKAEYGLYKQVLYVYSTLLGLFSLGLPKAFSYFLPRSPLNEAKSLINKITNLFYVLGALLSLVFFLGADYISEMMNSPELGGLLKLFAPVPFLMMPTLGLEGILATYKKTKFVSVYMVLTRIAMLLCICMPVIAWGAGVRGAIIGFVISSFVSFVLALYLKHYPVRNAGNDSSTESYRSIFSFCFPLFVASIWGILINSTDQFFISRYFGNEVFADFSNGSMELPFIGIIVGATTTVLTPLFTRQVFENASVKETILPVWINALSKSAMLIYPLVIFCIYDATDIMVLLYGENYVASADYLRIKSLTYFLQIIAFYSIIVALDGVRFYQWAHFVYLCVLLVMDICIVSFDRNPLMISGAQAVCRITCNCVFFVYIAKRLKTSIINLVPLQLLLKIIFASLFAIMAIWIIRNCLYSEYNIIVRLTADIILMALVYFVLSKMLKLNYISIMRPLFHKS